jgi:hypothetical protein
LTVKKNTQLMVVKGIFIQSSLLNNFLTLCFKPMVKKDSLF